MICIFCYLFFILYFKNNNDVNFQTIMYISLRSVNKGIDGAVIIDRLSNYFKYFQVNNRVL